MNKFRRISIVGIRLAIICCITTTLIFAAIPKGVQDRFVLGDPVWKELIVRENLRSNYEDVWKNLVEIIIDNGFEVGFMEKDSGYIRSNENARIILLKNYWRYDIKVVAKIILNEQAQKERKSVVEKIRVQVIGHVYRMKKGTLRESYSGYDRIVMQDLLNDLQLFFGDR